MELSDFASILLYLAVFLSAIAFAYIGQKKNSKTLCFLSLLLPILIASFRYSSGTDSLTYRSFYTEIGSEDIGRTMGRFYSGGIEPFVIFFSVIGNALHLPVSFLFFGFALITVCFLYAITKLFDKKNAWLYYGMLLLIVFPESLNMMRQIAAISVQAFALLYIFSAQRKNERAHISLIIILAALSVTLHYSSILLLPVLLLPSAIKRFSWNRLAVALCLLSLICLFAFPSLLTILASSGILSERHLTTFMSIEGSLINVKFFASVILSGVLIANYHRRRDIIDKQYSILMLAGVVYSSVGFYSGYLGRLAMLFWVFVILIFTETLCQLFEKKNRRVAVCLATAVVYFVLYYGVFGLSEIMPYSFAL